MPVFNKMVYNGTEYILGGGGNIGEPLNLTVTTSGPDATITWEDNEIGTIPPTTFQKSELVRKIGSAPTSPSDGVLVVTETVKDTYKTTGYTDQGLTIGETYYYRVFSYSDLGGISYCDAVSVTPSSSRQPGVNTVGYWKLDGNANDSGPNSLSTSITGSITYGTQGSLTYGIFNSTVLRATYSVTSSFTINTWCKPVNYNNSRCRVGAWGFSGNGPQLCIGLCGGNQGTIGTWIVSQIDGGVDHYTNLLHTTDWHNVVLTQDNNTISLYVDGNNIPFTNSGTIVSQGGDVIKIGEGGAAAGERWKGYLSEYIIEDKAWTLQEIQDYFNQTKGDYGIS